MAVRWLVALGLFSVSFGSSAKAAETLTSRSVSKTSTAAPTADPTQRLSLPKSEIPVAPAQRPFEIRLGMGLEGSATRDSHSENRDLVATGITIGLKWNMMEWFYLEAEPKVRFASGHLQSATPTNGRDYGLSLKKGDFVLSDQNFFKASAGALDLTQLHSTLLMANPLPGAHALVSSGEKNPFAVAGFIFAGVPSSVTLTNNSDDVDRTPTFGSAGLRARLKTENFEGKFQLAAFRYQNLPSNVGNDSVKLGNTAAPGSPYTSMQALAYQYGGYEGLAEIDVRLSTALGFKSQLAAILNREAPDELNKGYSFTNSLDVGLTGEWTLIPSFVYFSVEPDAAVANYNDDRINTNRVGYLAGLALQYKKLFKLGGVGGERSTIFDSPYQGRERYIGLTLEALNVAF